MKILRKIDGLRKRYDCEKRLLLGLFYGTVVKSIDYQQARKRQMKNTNRGRFKMKRVDAQVSILMACIVAVSCFAVYLFGYTYTYRDMIRSLEDRVYSIYDFAEAELDLSTFVELNTKEDMTKESYRRTKSLFASIKNATGVQYLYTAKRNPAGELIYVIDGLPSSAPDFRYPGDLIEPEIVDKLNRALAGEVILPKNILHTSWGDIFITYLPMYGDNGQVVGVMGIEFAAGHQYQTYRTLRIAAPIIILGACALGTFFALLFFRRISNPHFQDIANTDYLTTLKNRNAYELDLKNICAQRAMDGIGLLVADLNGLKHVNDTLGHEVGDSYIKAFGEALRAAVGAGGVLYRIGGDEFLAMVRGGTAQQLEEYMQRIELEFRRGVQDCVPNGSCSIGSAICVGDDIAAFEMAYRLADAAMYENKKIYYALEAQPGQGEGL